MVKQIIAISGSGIGSGKSTAASKLADEVWSLAGTLRDDLRRVFPGTDWYDKSQEYKARPFGGDVSKVAGLQEMLAGKESLSNRDIMIAYGQAKCNEQPTYWARRLAEGLRSREQIADGVRTVAIDDLRKVCEIEYLRTMFGDRVIHLHIDTGSAIPEANYDNEQLRDLADYVLSWEKD